VTKLVSEIDIDTSFHAAPGMGDGGEQNGD
jgi:hypothetical protein